MRTRRKAGGDAKTGKATEADVMSRHRYAYS